MILEPSPGVVIAGAVLFVGLMLLNILWLSTRYQRVGPHEALIVYGRGQTQIIVGGGAFVWPFFTETRRLSLAPVQVEATVAEPLDGAGPARAQVRAQVALSPDPDALRVAATRLAEVAPEGLAGTAQAMLEARVREWLRSPGGEGATSAERLASYVRIAGTRDLAALGVDLLMLDVVSVFGA